jgi:hypothetical protein
MRRRTLLGLLGLLLAVLAAGCGRQNPALIPEDDAARLTASVDRVDEAIASGDCEGATELVQRARTQVTELPRRVSVRLKDNLDEWLVHLGERIPSDCEPEAQTTPEPTATATETATPTPTAEETETPTPTPTPTATPTATASPEPTATQQPEDNGGVNGGEG